MNQQQTSQLEWLLHYLKPHSLPPQLTLSLLLHPSQSISPDLRTYDVIRRGKSANPHGRGLNCRSEEHTSELQSRGHLVCRLLLEKKKKYKTIITYKNNSR